MPDHNSDVPVAGAVERSASPARDLSIFQLESELAELMDFRDNEELTAEERQAVDNQIAEYLKREITKVDNLRAYMRHCSIMEQAAKEEAELQAKRAKSWRNRLDYLKGCCLASMEFLKKKKLEGRTGYILAKANGGKQALTIYDESLVPNHLCMASVRIGWDIWERVLVNERDDGVREWLRHRAVREPLGEAIRHELDMPCARCGGTGEVCPAGPSDAPMEPCDLCNRSGKQIVPGARLEPRGSHVEVK